MTMHLDGDGLDDDGGVWERIEVDRFLRCFGSRLHGTR